MSHTPFLTDILLILLSKIFCFSSSMKLGLIIGVLWYSCCTFCQPLVTFLCYYKWCDFCLNNYWVFSIGGFLGVALYLLYTIVFFFDVVRFTRFDFYSIALPTIVVFSSLAAPILTGNKIGFFLIICSLCFSRNFVKPWIAWSWARLEWLVAVCCDISQNLGSMLPALPEINST